MTKLDDLTVPTLLAVLVLCWGAVVTVIAWRAELARWRAARVRRFRGTPSEAHTPTGYTHKAAETPEEGTTERDL